MSDWSPLMQERIDKEQKLVDKIRKATTVEQLRKLLVEYIKMRTVGVR
jgi:hypothetical protein